LKQNDLTVTENLKTKEVGRMNKRNILILALLGTLLVGCGTNIPSGHHGVKYMRFRGGTVMGKIYGEGFRWHLPWNSFFVYKTQTDERREDLHILSADGASIEMEASIWFRPIVGKLDSLQITVGSNYYEVVVGPALRGEARSIVGRYKPDEIYSTRREVISSEILEAISGVLDDKFIEVENVIIRNVVLPPKIVEAINEKLTADQEQQRMEFVLLRETQEAERKRIEAQGIHDFQRIVTQGLTQNLLLWKGIEATEKLAASENTKIVVIGSSKSGLPLILGGEK
jgi:regulator of protease activity HflC (stomatin/prohibitin superfamily)